MASMHEVDLRKIDLNLLVALNAFIEERSVTRAARRLGMSQPAASRALARLRSLFADALLVDGPGGYALTARADELHPILQTALSTIGEMFEGRGFDPLTATGKIRLVLPDFQAAFILPHLLTLAAAEAPLLDFDVSASGTDALSGLETGAADVMIGIIEDAPAGIRRRHLYDEAMVTLMRAEHSAASTELTLDAFSALEHVVVSVPGLGIAPVDEALTRLGRRRRVKLRIPNFFAALEIVAGADLVLTLPSSLARTAGEGGRFVLRTPPVQLGSFPMSLAWHARHQDSPRHIWLRKLIVEAVAAARFSALA